MEELLESKFQKEKKKQTKVIDERYSPPVRETRTSRTDIRFKIVREETEHVPKKYGTRLETYWRTA